MHTIFAYIQGIITNSRRPYWCKNLQATNSLPKQFASFVILKYVYFGACGKIRPACSLEILRDNGKKLTSLNSRNIVNLIFIIKYF